MNQSREQVLQMHRLYEKDLWPMEVIGEVYGLSHESVRKLFLREKLPTRARGSSSTSAIRNLRAAQQRHKRIIDSYKLLGNVEQVAKEFDLPSIYVSRIINNFSLRELYRRKGTQDLYSNEYMEECIRRAADIYGEPLTIPGYRVVARAMGFPTDATLVKHYHSFGEACNAAGVKHNPPRGSRSGTIEQQQCIEALQACRETLARIPTYVLYCDWAQENSRPSGPTVRNKCGSWSNALRLAFDPS